MSCVYLLDGHLFNSELELDDFLLEKNYLRKELGDIVFQVTTHQATSMDVLEKANKIALEKESEYEYAYQHRGVGEERDSYNFRAPYIGVNKFLSGFTTDDGELLYPEFREDNYWGVHDRSKGRFGDWSKGIYTDDELKFFVEIGKFTDEEHPLKISDTVTQNEFRALIEKKWELQALIGDAMHSILLFYFTKVTNPDGTPKLDSNGNYIYNKDLLKQDPSFIDTLYRLLSDEKYGRENDTKIKFSDLITFEKFSDTLEKVKQIGDKLEARYPGAVFYPEFKITGKVERPRSDGVDTLMGIVDLLILDKNGCPHIVDYKTSIHPRDEFSTAKILGYTYLILTYGRLIAKAGINIADSDYLVIPIHIADFQYSKDKFEFSGFNLMPGIFDNITNQASDENKNSKLNDIIDYPYTVELSTLQLGENILETMSTWFPTYQQYKQYDIEDAKKICEDAKAFEADETGKLNFIPKGSRTGKPVVTIDPSKVSNPEDEMVKKVLKWLQDRPRYRERLVNNVKKAIKDGIKQGSVDGIKFTDDIGQDWFSKQMMRYCNPNWTLCEGENFKPLEAMGIITLFNPTNRQYNFIKISTLNLKRLFNFGSDLRTTLGGAFKSDLYFKSNPDSMMMQGTYGNIELVETMLALNQIHKMFEGDNACVGDIMVADPQLGIGISAASNMELYKTFNELEDSCGKINTGNNFRNGKVKMAAKVQLARTMLSDAMAAGKVAEEHDGYNRYSKFNEAKSTLDRAIESQESIDIKIEALLKIIKLLQSTDDKRDLVNYTTDQSLLAKDHVALYNQCMLAIAELKGINFRQQLKDHASWVETLQVHKGGLSGNMLDNPGNLSSETLNLITKLTTEAYQNVRADMQEPALKLRKLTDALKKDKNFGWLQENTVGNQADLYKNMLDYRNGDVYFKNPWDNNAVLSKAEREYLKYILPIINNNRLGRDAEETKLNDPNKYFRIPLCEGNSASVASKDGLLLMFKDRLKEWNPKTAWENAKSKLEGIYDDKMQQEYLASKKSTEELFEMTNNFDYGEGKLREKMLARGRFETNLETLALKHIFAYSMQDRVDEVMPMIKAAMIHLTTSGFALNEEFTEDLQYGENYVKNKIKNESIIPEKYKKANELANKFKQAASKLVLGFSPVQFLYQTIQGLWNDISLIIRKPDGTDAFTLKNMLTAAKIVYHDLTHFGDTPTIIEEFNRLYGVNDMDMNSYIDKIKSDQNGIFNFNNFLFKFASRPDYYNRMTIFVAKMINEGSLEAHKLNKDGLLEYDCAKDKRYKAFFDDDRSDMEKYNLAKANYIAAAKQFEKEHALNQDGTEFKLDLTKKTKLPRAYTNLEAESMKSLSDTIYGYYSHEKKSMIQATLWGSLFMQFKTFWSGKKNQYLATGGVKLEGRWVPYTEKDDTGKEIHYYYQKDSDGNILFNKPPVKDGDPNASTEMVVRWEGNWKEGILATMFLLTKGMYHEKSISKGWDLMWYAEDLNLRNAYRSNIKLLGYDTAMFLVFGNMLGAALAAGYEKEKKESSKTDFADALKLSAMNIGIKSLKNSFLDFNFINSIGDPAINWTPFAFEYTGNQVSSIWDTVMGDLNIWTTIAQSNSLFSQFKPVFYTIKERNKQ